MSEQRGRSTGKRAIVVLGGVVPDITRAATLGTDEALVVAADSGAVHAIAAGLTIDIAVGDFDSIPARVLEDLEREGVRIERHPVAKDATDLELAIDAAVREGADVVTVVGGHGGRVDQSIANVMVVASPRYLHVAMHALIDSALVSVVHGGGAITFEGRPGEVVTLVPVHGDATGVRTQGLAYPLHGESLPMGTTRGVSNQLIDPRATVSLDAGTLLVVRPGPEKFDDDGGNTE